MRQAWIAALMACGILMSGGYARGTLFHEITAETGGTTHAVINANGSLTESGTNYVAIYKPTTPPPANVHAAVIDTAAAFNGKNSIGFEIDPTPSPDPTGTDKTQLRVSHAGDASDLVFDNTRYLGFALNIPAATFQAPTTTTGVQIAQWFQGAPYGPPLSLDITGGTSTTATYKLQVLNNSTLGNPSSVPIVLGSGSIALGSWNTFVIMTVMDFSGNGHVELWQNGVKLVDFTGSDAYDPSTIPYKNPPVGTANPNSAFDVFVGPYRPQQSTEQVELFDDVKWADTFADALPVATPEPGTAGIAVAFGGWMCLRRRRRVM